MMKCREFRTGLARWMEDSWDHSESSLPTPLVDHTRNCAECEARLHAATALVSPAQSQTRVPEDLRSRIMNRVLRDSPGMDAKIQRFPPADTSEKHVRRVVWFAAAAAVLVLATSLATIALIQPRMGNQVEVHLVLEAPTARSVSVVGDWNAWDPGTHRLVDSDGDGKWEITIHVERGGEYRYQFIVDEENWISDPAAPLQIQDGFGGTNSILNI